MSIETEVTAYFCTPEWHLARLRDAKGNRTPFAAVLYPFAVRLSKQTRKFHASAERIAAHFGVSKWTVIRAMEALVTAGFFIVISKEAFRPSVYRVVLHKEWAAEHSGNCAVKEKMPWSGETGDPLAVELWNISGGKIQYRAYQLAAIRKTGHTDNEIVREFNRFIEQETGRREVGGWHGRWNAAQHRFRRWLGGDLEIEGLEVTPPGSTERMNVKPQMNSRSAA